MYRYRASPSSTSSGYGTGRPAPLLGSPADSSSSTDDRDGGGTLSPASQLDSISPTTKSNVSLDNGSMQFLPAMEGSIASASSRSNASFGGGGRRSAGASTRSGSRSGGGGGGGGSIGTSGDRSSVSASVTSSRGRKSTRRSASSGRAGPPQSLSSSSSAAAPSVASAASGGAVETSWDALMDESVTDEAHLRAYHERSRSKGRGRSEAGAGGRTGGGTLSSGRRSEVGTGGTSSSTSTSTVRKKMEGFGSTARARTRSRSRSKSRTRSRSLTRFLGRKSKDADDVAAQRRHEGHPSQSPPPPQQQQQQQQVDEQRSTSDNYDPAYGGDDTKYLQNAAADNTSTTHLNYDAAPVVVDDAIMPGDSVSVAGQSERSSVLGSSIPSAASAAGRTRSTISGAEGGNPLLQSVGSGLRSSLRNRLGGGQYATNTSGGSSGTKASSHDTSTYFTSTAAAGSLAVAGGDSTGGGSGTSSRGTDRAVYATPGASSGRHRATSSASPSAPSTTGESVASTSTPSRTGGGGGGKVARLASLFSGRTSAKGGSASSTAGAPPHTTGKIRPDRGSSASSAAAAATATASSSRPFEDPFGSFRSGSGRAGSDMISSPTMSTANSGIFPLSSVGDASMLEEDQQLQQHHQVENRDESHLHDQTIQEEDDDDENNQQQYPAFSMDLSSGYGLHNKLNLAEDSSFTSSAATSSNIGLPAAGSAPFIRRRAQHQQYHSGMVPASPVHSAATGYSSGGGSAAYVGWPGTQTKDGRTVEIKQTFSESDTSGLHRPPSSTAGPPGTPSLSSGGAISRSGQWIDAGDVMGNGSDSDTEDGGEAPRQPQLRGARSTNEAENPADYHLAAALADVRAAATTSSSRSVVSNTPSSPVRALRPSPLDAPPYHNSRHRSTTSTSTVGSVASSRARAKLMSPGNVSAHSFNTPVSAGPSPMPSPGGSSPSGSMPVHLMASNEDLPSPSPAAATPGATESPAFDWPTSTTSNASHRDGSFRIQNLNEDGLPTPASATPQTRFFAGGSPPVEKATSPSRVTQRKSVDAMGEDDLIDDEDDIGGRVINIGSPFAPPSPPSKSSRKQLPVADGGAVPNGIDISGSASRVLASGRSPVSSPEKEAGHRGSSSSFKRGGLPPQPSPTVSASSLRRDSSGNSRRRATSSQPLSEAALREKEMLSSSSPQAGKINARNIRGYRGFFDKTRDVPNLIDAEDSESMATETTAPSEQAPGPAYGMTAAVVAGQRSAGLRTPSSSGIDSSSDVFDGVSDVNRSGPSSAGGSALRRRGSKGSAVMNIIRRSRKESSTADGGANAGSLSQRESMTAASPLKALGMSPVPTSNRDVESQAGSSLAEYSLFYIPADQVRKLVRKYRKMTTLRASYPDADVDVEEDAKKAFALFEMRSRIMETDIDRGLERTGGTVPVDDLVTTPYAMAATRIRDAVVVSKAWRDGATPRDVITASLLTRRSERTYYIQRKDDYGRSAYEEVQWLDDTDFAQLRCPSLGPRCMRGFEMFTIGDCQSILLKLTHERCQKLRSELQLAILRQLSAEKGMKEEEGDDSAMFDDSGMMSEAEMTYLEAMETVKSVSKRLVYAENAFGLVKERIEALIEKYEDFLVKINEDDESVISFSASSYTDGQSDFSSQYTSSSIRNKETLALRAKRAEILTEMKLHERQRGHPSAQRAIEKKQRELDSVQEKLADAEASSQIESDYDKSLTSKSNGDRPPLGARSQIQLAHDQANHRPEVDQARMEARERIKEKFRSRRAEKLRQDPFGSEVGSALGASSAAGATFPRNRPVASGNTAAMMAGEEMYQHLDFYERSLKAVQNN